MVVARPSLLSDRQVRELTGLSRAQFAELVIEVGKAWEEEREARLSGRPGRQRAFGAGRKHQVPFAGRLLLTLVYLRWNVTFRMLAALWDIDKDSAHRAVTELTPLLARLGITAPDGSRVTDVAALEDQLRQLSVDQRAALLDGSFVPVPRPGGGWDAQKAQYSPHRHRHVNSFQALTDDHGRLLWTGAVCPGATHDLTAIATSEAATALAGSEVVVIADKAYAGIVARLGLAGAFTPRRRRRKGDDRPEPVRVAEAEFNTEVSRQRVHVEHAIRTLKIRRVLHGYRRRLASLPDTLGACAALATYPT